MNNTYQTRTENSARNIKYATIGRVIAILIGYVSRVVFTHTLSETYVGINGLFTDIVNVLSLTELGFGTAISYALYKPIAEGDIEKQKTLMQLFKKFYLAVAAAVTVLGLSVVPFLDYLIKGNTEVEHVRLIYLMYVMMTVFSYFCIYKRTLMDAYQMNHIGEIIFSSVVIGQTAIQICVLYFTHNFFLYISLMIIGNITNNLIVSKVADMKFPFLQDKDVVPIAKEEKEGIVKNVKAMLMHKLGDVVVNNTDNLLLSSVVGIVSAGLYSNYFLVIESVKGVLNQVFNSITGSIGNLGVTEKKERVKKIYDALFFIGNWIYGVCAVCLYEALDYFVGLSFGANYVFDRQITLMLCVNFYVTGMRMATLAFRNTLGLFYYDRYKSIFTAIINLFASIVLGYYFGAWGIFAGTFISTLLTSFWVEPYVLYKKYFKQSVWPYFAKYGLFAALTLALGYICELICANINFGAVPSMIIRAVVSFAIMNLGYLLVLFRSKEFILLCNKALFIINKRKEKKEASMSKENDKGLEELCQALSIVLDKKKAIAISEDEDWNVDKIAFSYECYDLAQKHGISALLYPIKDAFPEDAKAAIVKKGKSCVNANMRLCYMARYLINAFDEAGIEVALLKGAILAKCYPIPELRLFGDVDLLLLDEKKFQEAEELLLSHGCVKSSKQDSNHHVEYRHEEGMTIELHVRTTRAFEREKANDYIGKIYGNLSGQRETLSLYKMEYKVLPQEYNALYILLHMLQHYLNSGFGFNLICDFHAFWQENYSDELMESYNIHLKELGLSDFSDYMSKLSLICLKGDLDRYPWSKVKREEIDSLDVKKEIENLGLIDEILASGHFGENDSARVVNLSSNSFAGLFGQFHLQTKENFPKASKIFITWPVIWIATLVIFMKNNSKIRKKSTLSVIRTAYMRGKVSNKLNLWKE